MTIPKKTKFRAMMNLDTAIADLAIMGFTKKEVQEIIREILRRWFKKAQ